MTALETLRHVLALLHYSQLAGTGLPREWALLILFSYAQPSGSHAARSGLARPAATGVRGGWLPRTAGPSAPLPQTWQVRSGVQVFYASFSVRKYF